MALPEEFPYHWRDFNCALQNNLFELFAKKQDIHMRQHFKKIKFTCYLLCFCSDNFKNSTCIMMHSFILLISWHIKRLPIQRLFISAHTQNCCWIPTIINVYLGLMVLFLCFFLATFNSVEVSLRKFRKLAELQSLLHFSVVKNNIAVAISRITKKCPSAPRTRQCLEKRKAWDLATSFHFCLSDTCVCSHYRL